jgi:hypothetical protein
MQVKWPVASGGDVPEVALGEDSTGEEGINTEQDEGANRKTQRPQSFLFLNKLMPLAIFSSGAGSKDTALPYCGIQVSAYSLSARLGYRIFL